MGPSHKPQHYTTVSPYLIVNDASDTIYKRALQAGATSVQAPVKKEDPDKRGGVQDAGGTTWWIATRVE